MPTSPTVATVKTGLVTQLTTKLATAGSDGGQVQVSYAWPGPDTKPESVFFGTSSSTGFDSDTTADYTIPLMQAGRKQRDETYELPLTVWVHRGDLKAADAAIPETRAFVLAGLITDVFVDDPQAGQGALWFEGSRIEARLFPRETGWACAMTITITVHFRLT
jgi:hypothetical protein